MRTAIYIRVSTEEQAKEGYSIAAQKDRLTSYAKSQDWIIIDYYMDEGLSAKDTVRPELQRLLQDVRDNNVDIILFYKLDRLTRSVKDLYEMWEEVSKYKTDLRSATEPIDTTTPIGRALMGLLGIFAQLERETLAERVKDGMRQMVIEGKWHGGIAPYGYIYTDGEFQIYDKEASLVKRLFDMYLSGKYGDNSLAIWLNKRGYTTKNGSSWSHTAVSYILQNLTYIGILHWKSPSDKEAVKVENAVPVIIDHAVFDQVQKMRKGRAKIHPRSATSTYIFSGSLRCGRCGAAMKGNRHTHKSVEYRYYSCTKKRHGLCNLPYINEVLLNKMFLERIQSIQDLIESESASSKVAATSETKNDSVEKLSVLKSELEKIKSKRKKWQHAFASDVVTLEELKDRLAEDHEQEEEIQKQISKIEGSEKGFTLSHEQFKKVLAKFTKTWESAANEQRKSLLQILVDSITVNTPFDVMPKAARNQICTIEDIQFNE